MKTLMADCEKHVMTSSQVEAALQHTPRLIRREGIQFYGASGILISIPPYFCEDFANVLEKTLESMAENPAINSKGVWKMAPPCAAERGHTARINAMHKGVVQGITDIQDEHKRDLKNSDLLEQLATAYQKVGELLQENGGLKQKNEQFKAVYREFNNLLCHIGYEGSVDADSRYVWDAMQALKKIDGGVYGEQFSEMGDVSIEWPSQRDVGRIGDMSPQAHIRVGLDTDNDAYVSVWDEKTGATIEFCTPGAGGGKSSRTRKALIGLMVAIEKDNFETPCLDWWAQRGGCAAT